MTFEIIILVIKLAVRSVWVYRSLKKILLMVGNISLTAFWLFKVHVLIEKAICDLCLWAGPSNLSVEHISYGSSPFSFLPVAISSSGKLISRIVEHTWSATHDRLQYGR